MTFDIPCIYSYFINRSASRLLNGDSGYSLTIFFTQAGFVFEYCLNAHPIAFRKKNSCEGILGSMDRSSRSTSVFSLYPN